MAILGRAALLLALAVAVYAVVMSLLSRRRGHRAWEQSAERGVYAVFGFTTVAILTMWVALATDSFELRNVAEYSSSTLDAQYKVTALWGSQAGSLLLWAWILSGFSALVVATNRSRNRELMPVVTAVLMTIAVFFLGLLSFVSSPFETLAVVPDEGRGLNPLLQNPYMQAHPPLLYLGFVGLSVPFAFAMAALVTRKLDTAWITSVRRWTIFSWIFLGVGIVLGAKWAYETLGWGGYWAWDPVENAAFMPWLVATAFLHSVMVQERRGMLKVWNMVLVILAFTLCLFGTFLTRSGIISSVHAFGESTLGPFFLAFIALVLVGSVGLLITRLPLLRSQHTLESYVSREAVFLFNNLLLVGLAFAVFWGTVFPVLSEAVRGEKITVGQGYYDQIATPIGVALLVLTGVGPLVAWRKASVAQLRRRFVTPLAVAAVAAVPLLLFTDLPQEPVAAGTVVAGVFVAACIAGEFWRGTRVRHALGGVSWPGAFVNMVARNRRRYGGYAVHLGIVVLFIGFAGSKGFVTETDVALREGDRADVAGYTFVNEGSTRAADEHSSVVSVQMGVFKGGDRVATMRPGVETFAVDETRNSKVAIDTSPTRDLYLFLSQLTDDGLARVTVFVNPLVVWIWVAGVIIFLGGLLAAWPGPPSARRERASSPAAERGAPA
ncbi:heme lyase CcmF/NrfE family subunit [Miltoncostaea marina]|uniref:heme lyase CcmF/NrfE family subunit n=1 Tax=Miltoncostaea marina TaxID=2843215 RepID=UPI001C3C8E2F|nr:heme lyase CcmF/NrfE family subunit [Miltoncostaea marina]